MNIKTFIPNSKSVTVKIALLVIFPIILITSITVYSLSSTIDTFHHSDAEKNKLIAINLKITSDIIDLKDSMLEISNAAGKVQVALMGLLLEEEVSLITEVITTRNEFKNKLPELSPILIEVQQIMLENQDNNSSIVSSKENEHPKKTILKKIQLKNDATLKSLMLDNNKLNKLFGQFANSNDKTLAFSKSDDFFSAINNFVNNDKVLNLSITKLISDMSKTLNDFFTSYEKAYLLIEEIHQEDTDILLDNQKLLTYWLLVIGSIAIAGLAVLYAYKKLSLPLKTLAEVMVKASKGDTNVTIPKAGNDEIGVMCHSLSSFVDVFKNMNQLVTQIDAASQEQAASTEELSATCEEMTALSERTTENTSKAKDLAREAKEHAEKGATVVSETIAAMSNLKKSSSKVADIISVINDISFQTNLLALNAAIEAERAGEQGRGFAVVATEVQKLAQKSSDAVKEIKALITDSMEKTEEGTTMVNQSGEVLKNILASISEVDIIVNNISTSSSEQFSGIQQINAGVLSIDKAAQQNATMVESISMADASKFDDNKRREESTPTVAIRSKNKFTKSEDKWDDWDDKKASK